MEELFAGYTNYSSTQAVLSDRMTAGSAAHPDSSLTVTVSWSWSWTFTFTWTA
jgi:hypothetical protein